MKVEDLQAIIRTADLAVSQVVVLSSPEARETLCSNTSTRIASSVVVSEVKAIVKYLLSRTMTVPGTSRVTSSKIRVSKINPPDPNLPNHDDMLLDEYNNNEKINN